MHRAPASVISGHCLASRSGGLSRCRQRPQALSVVLKQTRICTPRFRLLAKPTGEKRRKETGGQGKGNWRQGTGWQVENDNGGGKERSMETSFLTFNCLGTHPTVLRLTPNSVLRDHSWQGLGDHVGCRRSNPEGESAKASFPRPKSKNGDTGNKSPFGKMINLTRNILSSQEGRCRRAWVHACGPHIINVAQIHQKTPPMPANL